MHCIKPGATIGLIGGGQLGRMMALAGRNLGYKFVLLDPTPHAPASAVCDEHIVAPFDDLNAICTLADRVDIATFEFEHVEDRTLEMLDHHIVLPQGTQLMYMTKQRSREKAMLENMEVPIVPYAPISRCSDLWDAYKQFGRCIVKSLSGGYDGLFQHRVQSEDDVRTVWGVVEGTSRAHIAEQWLDFKYELSVVVARTEDENVLAYPPSVNVHRNGILHTSTVACDHGTYDEVQQKAVSLALRIAKQLNVVGLLTVEMFVDQDDTIYVNELAPRPHNSGHYSMDACSVSQFEQHIRAICGLPLQGITLWSPVVMVNVLGQHAARVHEAFVNGQLERNALTIKIHNYDKVGIRRGRKMGHINVLCRSVHQAEQWIRDVKIWDE
jgi:5-(carboxyamino)imidazole ribonucleotide synthase